MPNADFVGLVQSLLSTAEGAMGEFSPVHHRVQNDGLARDRARKTVESSLRLLIMLQEKSRGNLDFTESDILSHAIQVVREYHQQFEA
ncbi:DUF1844 domain-containing protein [Deinococcus roseus]|uniref:DUF1844 domain-containing protein n=1 Tax=Deinococcus roseus TaxID=392414 RepID=A0ABQ2DJ65_9DEIO|nr:DUF1844 domain-containing protein [Deinococcus roseus]GGJ58095.1 hypothetical protein GCM10008938_50210 [Deinococcus roseus]